VTLLHALGSIDEVGWLLHPPLIDLLYRLGERSGMSWWKKRWTYAHKQLRALGVEDAVLEQAARDLGRDDPAIAPSGEGRDLAFTEFRTALGGDAEAASRWVQWAERRHLLVRGAPVTCTACSARSWLPMRALPPPVVCIGCGREIDQPFPPNGLSFTYRLGEPLRRVLETDSLGHLLVLRWFAELFDYTGLVGAHPGVTFTDPTTGKDVGEADVILLFPNGDLVPVEVKRRIAGVDPRTLSLMDTLTEALEAPWDALAVTQPARDCPELTPHRRDMPARCRFLLTDDQLHDDDVFWSMGTDPFAWAPRTAEEDRERQRKFVRTIRESSMEIPRDFTTQLLLKTDIE